MPPMVIADLGAGEGTISQLMAQRAKRVIAIDNSGKMVEFGAELARRHGIANLEYRLGDLEDVPIRSGTVDLAFLSQALHHARHPERALAEAWRFSSRPGKIAILDLNRHHFEEAREKCMPTYGWDSRAGTGAHDEKKPDSAMWRRP